ncbi:hypothetical protein TCAP_02746 [Tolypocladium capitatum]|uniref:Uncharacterized protein n=1 Tax=Tolypocladium capitatum TaxID=45235 RepID=A0A2K3QIH5_9HYPO|nr:hypothetical protein TCAP_02746 [Tolypocladium capitatum]
MSPMKRASTLQRQLTLKESRTASHDEGREGDDLWASFNEADALRMRWLPSKRATLPRMMTILVHEQRHVRAKLSKKQRSLAS